MKNMSNVRVRQRAQVHIQGMTTKVANEDVSRARETAGDREEEGSRVEVGDGDGRRRHKREAEWKLTLVPLTHRRTRLSLFPFRSRFSLAPATRTDPQPTQRTGTIRPIRQSRQALHVQTLLLRSSRAILLSRPSIALPARQRLRELSHTRRGFRVYSCYRRYHH